MMYKCINGLSPSYLCELFQPLASRHHHRTRSSSTNGTHLPVIRNEHGRKSFAFREAKIWNSLPPSLRDIKEYHHLLDQPNSLLIHMLFKLCSQNVICYYYS